MTTRLSQRKVKAGSPAYKNLLEEMQARIAGSGTDYVIPVGGIPRTDMSIDVQNAIAKAESETSYVLPEGGITNADLSLSVNESLQRADTGYQKPSTGIPITDLEVSIQERLEDFKDFYIYPSTGIPYVDLDSEMKELLQELLTRYDKPDTGIPMDDLSEEVQSVLDDSLKKYIKPDTGIPLSDLEVEVVLKSAFDKYVETKRSHADLDGIGVLTHTEIDSFLNEHSGILLDISDEIGEARGEYSTIGRRMDSAFFERHDFVIKDVDFKNGSLDNLSLSDDNILHFQYEPEPFLVEYYDMSASTGYEEDNKAKEEEVDVLELRWANEIFKLGGANYSSQVGVVIDGFIYAPRTGVYNFGIQASGEYQFVVNKTEGSFSASYSITSWDDDHVARPITVTLTGGQFYRFSLVGKNTKVSDSLLRVVWKQPGEKTFEPVKKEYFTKTGYNTSTTGVYETEVIDTEKLDIRKFNWSVITDHETPASYIGLEWRVSADGVAFGDWTPYTFGAEVEGNIERYIQAKLTFKRGATNASPVLKEIRLNYLSNKNNLYHEWEEARQGYPTLRAHMDALNDRINGVEDLATSITHSTLDTAWLQNVRFEHIDINLMRMHWEQLKALKTSAHIMPSGFVEDFHDLNLMDTNFHNMEVRDSRLYPLPHLEVFDTDLEWMQWDKLHTSQENGSLKLTFVATDTLTGTATRTAINNTVVSTASADYAAISAGSSYSLVQTPMWFQPFYVNDDDYKITTISTYCHLYGYNGYYGYIEFYLYEVNAAGAFVNGKHLGTITDNDSQWEWRTLNVNSNGIIPMGKKKFAIGIRGYCYAYGNAYITRATVNPPPPEFAAANNPENKNLYMVVGGAEVVNKYIPLKMEIHKGFHAEGEAQIVRDFGVNTNFIEPEVDITLNGGVVELMYSSSDDGETFSDATYALNEVPDGRFLKIWTRLIRNTTNLSPSIERLAIRHNPNDVVFQTKPVRVTRIPTHAIVDAVDSDNTDLSYEVSRDGGQTFRPIIPGVQTDLRDIGAGQEMVVRIYSSRFEQDDDVWIDYLGLQTITHEDYNDKSVIVAHHQVEIAEEGQRLFNVTKPFLIGDNSLQVYVNGVYQLAGVSYIESNNRTIVMTNPLMEGDYVVFRIATAAYEFEDSESLSEMLMETKQTIEATLPFLQEVKPMIEAIEEEQVAQNESIAELDKRMGAELTVVDGKVEGVKEDIAELAINVKSVDEQVTLIDTALQGLSSTDAVLSQQLTLLQQTVNGIKKDLEEVKALMAISTTEFEELKDRIETVEGGLESIQTQVGSIIKQLEVINSNDTKQAATILDVNTRLGTVETDYPKQMNRIDTETNERITSIQEAIIQTITDTDAVNDEEAARLDDRLKEIEYRFPSDAEKINRDKLALNLDSLDADAGTNGIQLESNVTFPTAGVWGSTITWQSDKPQFVSGSGVVNKPTSTQGDQAVLLTATISNGEATDTKLFTVNVEKLPPSDEEKVLVDKNALVISQLDQFPGKAGVQVSTDVELQATGNTNGSVITWSSSAPEYLSNDGVAVQPSYETGDVTVILTATLTLGSAVETKAFSVTVIAEDYVPPVEPEPEPEPDPIEPEPEPDPVEPEPEPIEPDDGKDKDEPVDDKDDEPVIDEPVDEEPKTEPVTEPKTEPEGE